MASEVERLLDMQQTGQYIPTPEEQESQQNGPLKPGPLFQQFRLQPGGEMKNESTGLEAIQAGYGNSRYDLEFDPEKDLEHRRALNQNGFWKIANGAMKGGVYAATTAVETVAGVIDGLLEGTAELGKQITEGDGVDMGSVIGKGVNNFTARSMHNIQQLSEQWFPNYKTLEERSPEYQDQWLRHIFTANFIGDSFLKNFGFTVGALAGGAAWSKALGAAMRAGLAGDLMKGVTAAAEGDAVATEALQNTLQLVNSGAAQTAEIAKPIMSAAKSVNRMKATHALFGSVISAMGEGTMEGVMARDEFINDYLGNLNREYVSNRQALRDRLITELAGSDSIRYVAQKEGENVRFVPELNEKGEQRFNEELKKLSDDYYEKRKFAEEQADKIAATTFLLNLPILTASNTIQFGRMFSGGWKTARNTLSRVGGGIEDGVAAYTGIGNRTARAIGNTVRNGASEAAEEMAQGFVSSGAKHVADARITSFNDDGYDPETMKGLGNWIAQMSEGGMAYLKDWKNWQEGFLGMITGLIGLPGRTWQGGVPGAIRESNEAVNASEQAAQALNSRINSEKFQNAWKGYVRHMKYENEMGAAIESDDQYSWKTANDKQLVNDVIMFANAGRLQDLKDLVDVYANMSDEEADQMEVAEAVTSKGNEKDIRNHRTETIEKVRQQAKEIKDNIDLYSNMYDALSARVPIDTPQAQIEELVATAMNIKAFEKRFLSMFDDVIKGVEKYVKPMSAFAQDGTELSEEADKLNRAKEIYSTLAEIYTGTGLPANTAFEDRLGAATTLANLGELINEAGDTELIQKIDDMSKIAEDRKAFLKKLVTLQNLSPADYEEQAQTPDKVIKEQKKEKAQEATETFRSVMDIQDRYADLTTRGEKEDLINTLRDAQESSAPSKTFINMYDTYNNFRNYLSGRATGIVNRSTGDFSHVAEVLLEDGFRKSADDKELMDNLSNHLLDQASVLSRLQQRVDSGELTEDDANPVLVNQFYNAAAQAIRDNVVGFQNTVRSTAGKETLNTPGTPKPAPKENLAGGVDSPEPASGSQKPAPGKTITPMPAATPASMSSVEIDNPVAVPLTTGQIISDAAVTYSDPTPIGEDAEVLDSRGQSVVGYYQQSIPEILLRATSGDTNTFVKAKEIINALKNASNKQEVSSLSSSLNDLVRDFVLFDENGNPVGKNAKFAPIYKWLQDNGAFEYIATQLKPEDDLVFCYMSGCPPYDGVPQVVVGVVKTRNDAGEITDVQPLTTLHRPNSVASGNRAQYAYIDELYDAIQSDFESRGPDGPLYVFGGKTNPITSKVFNISPGLVAFGREYRDIKDIPSYADDAPIVVIGAGEEPVVLRGRDAGKLNLFTPSRSNFEAGKTPTRYGHLYYMVRNGNDSYTPIALDVESLTKEVFDRAPRGGFVDKIKGIIGRIDNLVQTSNASADDLNKQLSPILKELNRYMVLNGVRFEFIKLSQETGPVNALNISWGEESNQQDVVEQGSSDTVLDLLAELARPIQLSPREERRADVKRNLADAIAEGLITSNAETLRQKGVNFQFDPWNPKTGKFERLLTLPGQTTRRPTSEPVKTKPIQEETVQVVSKREPQQISSSPVQMSTGNLVLDSVPKSFSELPKDLQESFSSKGITEEVWENAPEDVRKAFLDC